MACQIDSHSGTLASTRVRHCATVAVIRAKRPVALNKPTYLQPTTEPVKEICVAAPQLHPRTSPCPTRLARDFLPSVGHTSCTRITIQRPDCVHTARVCPNAIIQCGLRLLIGLCSNGGASIGKWKRARRAHATTQNSSHGKIHNEARHFGTFRREPDGFHYILEKASSPRGRHTQHDPVGADKPLVTHRLLRVVSDQPM